MSAGAAVGRIIWQPSAERLAASHLHRFAAWATGRTGRLFPDYATLHAWSIQEPGAFWAAVARFCDLRFTRGPSRIVDPGGGDSGECSPHAHWFGGARLNFAANLLRFRDDRPAILWRDERGRRRQLSHAALAREVARVAAGLRGLGVNAGDRVAAVLPNCPEAVTAMLAATSIGAVWSSCSPDFGVDGLYVRFGQIRPRVLIGADGYDYAGRRVDTLATLRELSARFPDPPACVLVPYLEGGGSATAGDMLAWEQLGNRPGSPEVPCDFPSLPFDHPLYILYSSGTTGPPKCIVHGAGGTLLQHLKEHILHGDLHPDDRLFYFTTCGWMMWNWQVSALATGAAIVLWDGSPFHPDTAALWRMAAEEGVTVFGTNPRYLSAVQKSGLRPGDIADLRALRTVLSTGSPLAPEGYDFVYDAVKADVQLASISGGTDIVSCFALGNPWLPVRRGELQSPGLGMAVHVFDGLGTPQPPGRRGELVCTRPFPSMPLGFLDDDDGHRYRAAYFERFPGVWAHGDDAEFTSSGGLVIHGRSDAVLNPGGVRIGTAELYRAVEPLAEIAECLAVGQRHGSDERIVLFVVLAAGVFLDEALEARIRRIIRESLTARHVPAVILQVPALPRTRSGKLTELAVRAVIHGEPVRNTEAIANPEALEHFRGRPELLG